MFQPELEIPKTVLIVSREGIGRMHDLLVGQFESRKEVEYFRLTFKAEEDARASYTNLLAQDIQARLEAMRPLAYI
jgi:hypothetical protein